MGKLEGGALGASGRLIARTLWVDSVGLMTGRPWLVLGSGWALIGRHSRRNRSSSRRTIRRLCCICRLSGRPIRCTSRRTGSNA